MMETPSNQLFCAHNIRDGETKISDVDVHGASKNLRLITQQKRSINCTASCVKKRAKRNFAGQRYICLHIQGGPKFDTRGPIFEKS